MRPHQAEQVGQVRGQKRRQCRTSHTHAEHTGRKSAPFGGVPGIDERHTHGEGRPGDTEEEPQYQQHRVGIPDETQTQHRWDRDEADRGHHHPAPVAIGQRPDGDTTDRPDEYGEGDEDGGPRG